jgi:membrane-bound inhibitor of C-type lysozyme
MLERQSLTLWIASARTVGAGIASAFLAMAGVSQAQAAPDAVHYACSASQGLTVRQSLSDAHVSFAGRTYDLKRRPSSIGQKYLAPHAALILDGDSAVFVAEDHPFLGTCFRTVPVASN